MSGFVHEGSHSPLGRLDSTANHDDILRSDIMASLLCELTPGIVVGEHILRKCFVGTENLLDSSAAVYNKETSLVTGAFEGEVRLRTYWCQA